MTVIGVVTVRGGTERLSARALLQVPFAVSRTLNDTVREIQQVQRDHIARSMILRRRAFVLRAVQIEKDDWARKDQLRARVRIGDTRGSQEQNAFGAQLVRHESGGVFGVGVEGRVARDGNTSWIPAREGGLRPAPSALAPKSMRPAGLGLWRTDAQTGAGTAGAAKRKGKRRTFSIINRQGELVGIYQRYGLTNKQIKRRVKKGVAVSRAERMDAGIKMLWRFEPTIRIRPRLAFIPTAESVVRRSITGHFWRNMQAALATAR